MPITLPDFEINDPRLWHYRAQVVRVVDGDTLDLLVDKGFGDYTRQRVRLLGVDTPELRPRRKPEAEKAAEKAAAIVAKDRVEELVGGKQVILKTAKAGKYGRWLGIIYLPEQDNAIDRLAEVLETWRKKSLNQILLDEGLAQPYPAK